MHQHKKIQMYLNMAIVNTHAGDSDLYDGLNVSVMQQNILSGNYMIPHKERGRWGRIGRVRFQSSPEGRVRILV